MRAAAVEAAALVRVTQRLSNLNAQVNRASRLHVAALQEVAGLNAISRVVPVTVALQLVPAN